MILPQPWQSFRRSTCPWLPAGSTDWMTMVSPVRSPKSDTVADAVTAGLGWGWRGPGLPEAQKVEDPKINPMVWNISLLWIWLWLGQIGFGHTVTHVDACKAAVFGGLKNGASHQPEWKQLLHLRTCFFLAFDAREKHQQIWVECGSGWFIKRNFSEYFGSLDDIVNFKPTVRFPSISWFSPYSWLSWPSLLLCLKFLLFRQGQGAIPRLSAEIRLANLVIPSKKLGIKMEQITR